MSTDTEFLARLYERFNARDMEGALSMMHQNVMWANGLEGGHVHGHEEVRDYWRRQWAMMDSSAEPTDFSTSEDGTIHVTVHLIARDRNGNTLFDKMAVHVFQIEGGLVRRFDPLGRRCVQSSARGATRQHDRRTPGRIADIAGLQIREAGHHSEYCRHARGLQRVRQRAD